MEIDVTEVDDAVRRMVSAVDAEAAPLNLQPLRPNRGRGLALCKFLRQELNIPEGVVWFSVHVKSDDIIRVNCGYGPRVPAE